jgi:hypothetical protein
VIVAMLAPGMVAMLTLWLLVYDAFARAGVGKILLAMGARERIRLSTTDRVVPAGIGSRWWSPAPTAA